MEITNRHREPWTQAHSVQGNPAHEQTQTPALLNPIKSERSNWLLRLSPDVLIKMMTHYLKLSETALLMLSCRHVQHLVNSHYPSHPWKASYQTQLHTHQYLHDPFSHLIQGLAKNRILQAYAYRQLYECLTQKCVPWGIKWGWVINDDPCKQIEMLSNGSIAVMGESRIVRIISEERVVTLTHYDPRNDTLRRYPFAAGHPPKTKIGYFDCMVPLESGGLVTTDCVGPEISQSTMRIWSAAGEELLM